VKELTGAQLMVMAADAEAVGSGGKILTAFKGPAHTPAPGNTGLCLDCSGWREIPCRKPSGFFELQVLPNSLPNAIYSVNTGTPTSY
jgi:hypothetical protein